MWSTIGQYTISFFVSSVVGLINYLTRYVLYAMTYMEKHKSITTQKTKYMSSLAINYIFNIGFIILLVNTDFSNIPVIKEILLILPFLKIIFFSGKFTDISRIWYSKVGISLLILVFSNQIWGYFFGIIAVIYKKIIFGICKRRQVLQK